MILSEGTAERHTAHFQEEAVLANMLPQPSPLGFSFFSPSSSPSSSSSSASSDARLSSSPKSQSRYLKLEQQQGLAADPYARASTTGSDSSALFFFALFARAAHLTMTRTSPW
jgi:hypothetical protein